MAIAFPRLGLLLGGRDCNEQKIPSFRREPENRHAQTIVCAHHRPYSDPEDTFCTAQYLVTVRLGCRHRLNPLHQTAAQPLGTPLIPDDICLATRLGTTIALKTPS
jgi:hypothetical protein